MACREVHPDQTQENVLDPSKGQKGTRPTSLPNKKTHPCQSREYNNPYKSMDVLFPENKQKMTSVQLANRYQVEGSDKKTCPSCETDRRQDQRLVGAERWSKKS